MAVSFAWNSWDLFGGAFRFKTVRFVGCQMLDISWNVLLVSCLDFLRFVDCQTAWNLLGFIRGNLLWISEPSAVKRPGISEIGWRSFFHEIPRDEDVYVFVLFTLMHFLIVNVIRGSILFSYWWKTRQKIEELSFTALEYTFTYTYIVYRQIDW